MKQKKTILFDENFCRLISIILIAVGYILTKPKEMKKEEKAKGNQGAIAFDRDALLALYKETESRIKSHRETLWEEVRRFVRKIWGSGLTY